MSIFDNANARSIATGAVIWHSSRQVGRGISDIADARQYWRYDQCFRRGSAVTRKTPSKLRESPNGLKLSARQGPVAPER